MRIVLDLASRSDQIALVAALLTGGKLVGRAAGLVPSILAVAVCHGEDLAILKSLLLALVVLEWCVHRHRNRSFFLSIRILHPAFHSTRHHHLLALSYLVVFVRSVLTAHSEASQHYAVVGWPSASLVRKNAALVRFRVRH